MSGSHLIAALMALTLSMAATSAPVPPVPANQAPPPRAVKPDVSLIVIDSVEKDDVRVGRVNRIGFRNGKMLPAEVLWERDERDAAAAGVIGREIRANRYLVSTRGAVFDLREKKLINTE